MLVVGNLLSQTNNSKLIYFNSSVQSYAWHPTTNGTIAISTHSDNSAPSLFLYDVGSETVTKDLSSLIPGPVVDLSFSSNGQKLALATRDNAEQEVTIIDLKSEEVTVLIADDATELKEIATRGRYLTARSEKYVYVWEFDGKNMGKYESELNSLGLSPIGG